MSFELELAAKTTELRNLQQQFDEFVESSKEIEVELESCVTIEVAKNQELQKKIHGLQEKLDQNVSKSSQYTTENAKLLSELSKYKEKCNNLDSIKKTLEIQNSDLSESIRVLEASVDDLQHKVSTIEEELYFAQHDLQELQQTKLESESRLKQELTMLQAELANSDTKPGSTDDPYHKEDDMKEMMMNLEEEIKILNHRLLESEQQNQELNDEVSRMTDELMTQHASSPNDHHHDHEVMEQLKQQISDMKSQIDQYEEHVHTSDKLINEMTHELMEKSQHIDKLQAIVIAKDEAAASHHVVHQQHHQLSQENDVLRQQMSDLNSKLNAMELRHTSISSSAFDDDIIPEMINPMSPRRLLSNTHSQSSSPSVAMSNKKDVSHIQLDAIYRSSPEQSPSNASSSSFARKEKSTTNTTISPLSSSTSASRRLSASKGTSNNMKRGNSSSLMIETSTSPHAADIIAIDDALDKIDLEQLLLESSTSIREATRHALMTHDVDMIKHELLQQTKQYENLKKSNAKLLQQVLLTRNHIQVCCRARPLLEGENMKDGGKICVEAVDDNEVVCYDRRAELWRSFIFDKVWSSSCTQGDVFEDIEPLLMSVLDGGNVCIMAYGNTGSGKTFTMNGYGKEFGVSYRTIHRIFQILDSKKSSRIILEQQSSTSSSEPLSSELSSSLSSSDEVSYAVEVSMLEIYNEQVYDLLDSNRNSTLDIRQHPDGGVHVPGLRQQPVSCLADVMKIFAEGSRNRSTASTNTNEHSSRSHLIMSVTVTSSTSSSTIPSCIGKVHLVDLAGSEKVSKSGVTGAAMKEAQHINKSLAALGDVLEALDQKSKHIPYRNSKLTYLLQDCFNGNSHTMMIVTTCPTERYADETLFTLQFASRIRNIRLSGTSTSSTSNSGTATLSSSAMNKRSTSSAYVKNLEESIKIMKNDKNDSKKQTLCLEETLFDMKREMKKLQEKYTLALSQSSSSSANDMKKNDIQLLSLQKQNQDLADKYSEEKELRWKLLSENESLQKMVRKLQAAITAQTNASSTSTTHNMNISTGATPRNSLHLSLPSPHSNLIAAALGADTPSQRNSVTLPRKNSATNITLSVSTSTSTSENAAAGGGGGISYPSPRSAASVRASVRSALSAPASRTSPSLLNQLFSGTDPITSSSSEVVINEPIAMINTGPSITLPPVSARDGTPQIDDLLDDVQQPEVEVHPASSSSLSLGKVSVPPLMMVDPQPMAINQYHDPPEISSKISAFLLASRPTPRSVSTTNTNIIASTSISPPTTSSLPSHPQPMVNDNDDDITSPPRKRINVATNIMSVPNPDKLSLSSKPTTSPSSSTTHSSNKLSTPPSRLNSRSSSRTHGQSNKLVDVNNITIDSTQQLSTSASIAKSPTPSAISKTTPKSRIASRTVSRSNSNSRSQKLRVMNTNMHETSSISTTSTEQPEDTGSAMMMNVTASIGAGSMKRQSSSLSTSSRLSSLTAATAVTSSANANITVASRSKDALLKHQERMDRIREQKSSESKSLADKLHFSRLSSASTASAANTSTTS